MSLDNRLVDTVKVILGSQKFVCFSKALKSIKKYLNFFLSAVTRSCVVLLSRHSLTEGNRHPGIQFKVQYISISPNTMASSEDFLV